MKTNPMAKTRYSHKGNDNAVRSRHMAPARGDVTPTCHKDLELTKKMSSHLTPLTSASPQDPKAEAKALLPEKTKKSQDYGTPPLKKAKQKETNKSCERGMCNNTAPQGTNLCLKRAAQGNHPEMRKLPRLRPNAQNPKRRMCNEQEDHPSEESSKVIRQEPFPNSSCKKSRGSRPQAPRQEKRPYEIGLPPIADKKCKQRHNISSSSTSINNGDGEIDDDSDLSS